MTPKEKRKVRLRIVNPPTPESSRTISLYHVQRYIRRGRALIDESGQVVFLSNTTDRIISAEVQLQINTRRGYDQGSSTGLATAQQMRGVPILRADIAMRA